MLKEIKDIAASINGRVVELRRAIHKNPELSGKEEATARLVAEVLKELGIEVRTLVGGFGVVGLLRGGQSKDGAPVIALRADMDALPITDKKSIEYASCVKGVMHACGHDAHTAILLGTAMVLSKLKDKLKGDVKFIFQPSEETSEGGAPDMIRDGALKDPVPSAIVALHAFPEGEAGTVAQKSGIMTASSDRFTITIRGKGGHASRPHQTVDAVLVAAMCVTAIHHISSRRVDPLDAIVISIGMLRAGTAPNVVAEKAEIKGTVRTVDAAVREQAPKFIEEAVKGVTAAYGATYKMEYLFGSPAVVNDKGLNDFVTKCAGEVFGEKNVVEMPEPLMGAEDFSYFVNEVPGVLFRLGTSNKHKGITSALHSSDFDIDESSLPLGVTVMSRIAADYLEKNNKK